MNRDQKKITYRSFNILLCNINISNMNNFVKCFFVDQNAILIYIEQNLNAKFSESIFIDICCPLGHCC